MPILNMIYQCSIITLHIWYLYGVLFIENQKQSNTGTQYYD